MDIANKTLHDIQVSIGLWDSKEGDPNWFVVKPANKEKWGRSDQRGYLMAVKKSGSEALYYVRTDGDIAIHSDDVYDGSTKISPVHAY